MNQLSYRIQRAVTSAVGEARHNKIVACWSIAAFNSGDLITPLLLRHYGFTPVHCYPNDQQAMLFSCGSLMEKVPYDFPGFVIGTGFMHAGSTRKYLRARILAVRGELTRDHIAGLPKDIILGDPGLLMPILMPKKEQKRFTLGVIPHYIDKKDEGIKKFCRRYKKEVRLIDIQQPPLKVVKDVDECEFILSSSLHGLVFADSLGIPNVWTILSDKVSGKGFKFQDYNSALKKEQFPMQFTGEEKLSDIIASTCLPSRQLVVEKSQALEAAFRQFKDEAGPNRG